MASSPILLPRASFAEISVDLLMLAHREAMGIEALEVFAARYPSDPTFRVVADIRRAAETLGDLHRHFRTLAPHEAEVRALLRNLDPNDPIPTRTP